MRQSFLFVVLLSLFGVGAVAQNNAILQTENITAIKSTLSSALSGGGAAGTDFYITFPPRPSMGGTLQYKIYVSSAVRAKVTLIVEGKGAIFDLFTVANDVIEFSVDSSLAQAFVRKQNDSIPTEQVYKQAAIHIKAAAPIVVYAFCIDEHGGGDSFLALPLNTLGREYIVSSMPDMGWMYGASFPSEFCVVAPYDNTSVMLTIGGNATTITSGGIKTGEGKTFSLNRGDVLVVANGVNSKEGDLSGSRIVSTKPIAVISGHQCANVPSDMRSCGYLAEMEIPTTMWGKQFLIPRYIQRNNSFRVKITAKEPNTKVYRHGQYWRTIKTAGGKVGTGFIDDRVDAKSNAVAAFTSDKPISITVFNPGTEEDGFATAPFQMLIFPVEQYATSTAFTTPGIRGAKGTARNYISVIYPLTANNTIPDSLEFGVSQGGKITWKPLSSVFGAGVGDIYTMKINGITYACKQCELLGDGVYNLRSNQPFMCYSYGSSANLAYGHPAGGTFNLNSQDGISPNPMWGVDCRGAVEGGVVSDLPNDPNIRSNLATIILDPELSTNYTLEYDDFIPGDAVSTKWSLHVDDLRKDAVAVITFTDRAGNDTTIHITYVARQNVHVEDVNFGTLSRGDRITQTATITNVGKSDEVVSRIEFKNGGANGMMKVVNLTLPFILKQGESRTIEVECTATGSGEISDSLGVNDNCTFYFTSLVRVLISGPSIAVSDIDFGQVKVGTVALKTFSISSKGTVDLVVTSASSATPDEGVFSAEAAVKNISVSNPLLLKPIGTAGDNTTFSITFNPIDKRDYTAIITFSSNATGMDSIVVLKGRGVDIVDVQEKAVLSAPHIESITPSPVGSDGSDIRFNLSRTVPVRLDIVNANGMVVATLLNTTMNEGEHHVHFVPAGIADGLYLVRMQAGAEFITKPLLLSR